jgi:hypothetical protein
LAFGKNIIVNRFELGEKFVATSEGLARFGLILAMGVPIVALVLLLVAGVTMSFVPEVLPSNTPNYLGGIALFCWFGGVILIGISEILFRIGFHLKGLTNKK